jgi:hypothetical protein
MEKRFHGFIHNVSLFQSGNIHFIYFAILKKPLKIEN